MARIVRAKDLQVGDVFVIGHANTPLRVVNEHRMSGGYAVISYGAPNDLVTVGKLDWHGDADVTVVEPVDTNNEMLDLIAGLDPDGDNLTFWRYGTRVFA